MADVVPSEELHSFLLRLYSAWGKRQVATLTLLSAMAIIATGAPAMAQDNYPSRPVKIIAPQAPGGGVDLVARSPRR